MHYRKIKQINASYVIRSRWNRFNPNIGKNSVELLVSCALRQYWLLFPSQCSRCPRCDMDPCFVAWHHEAAMRSLQ